MVFVGWFHPDVAHGVFWGSWLVTFVGSVMGDDQVKRLQNGAFGAAAGTSLGALAGLLKDQQTNLVVVGFVGSAVGGFLGWGYYTLLAWWISTNPCDPSRRSFLAFQAGGLAGLRDRIEVQLTENIKVEFGDWSDRFARTLAEPKRLLLKHAGTDDNWEEYAEGIMKGWLVSAADTVSLVFGTLADKATPDPAVKAQGQSGDQACSQSRVTIIVFGKDDEHKITGKHWIHYSGQLKPHNVAQNFNENSIGNKVLSKQYPSPYVTDFKNAGKDGEHRGQKNGEQPADDASNRPFVTFRLNDDAILSFDWPQGLNGNADYVVAARSLFFSVVTPALTEVLDSWPSPLAHEVDLKPLTEDDPRVAPAATPADAASAATPHNPAAAAPAVGSGPV
jgi:hypothetical protein